MGEMKVEHVLLFLVGAFLVYHMMGKCRRVEGMKSPPWWCYPLAVTKLPLAIDDCKSKS